MRLFLYRNDRGGAEVLVFVQASHRNKADKIMAMTMPNANSYGRAELRRAEFERLDGEVVSLATGLTPKQEAWNNAGRAAESQSEGQVQEAEATADNQAGEAGNQ